MQKKLRGQEQNTSIPNWPVDPTTMNFESWCLSIMPQEVYDDFVAPYTEKQWGRHPSKLAASFAPKRVQVRTDGDKRLFKDAYQGFPYAAQGGSYDQMLKGLLGNTQVHTRWKMNLDRICDELQRHPAAWRPDFVAITAPLDDFCRNEYGMLDWRGLTFSHKYVDTPRGYAQDAMVVNWPNDRVDLGPWIRPVLKAGRAVLFVEPGDESHRWRVAEKERVKQLSS